ncbi:MAG: flagellar biosynthesis anti-sigma factor FlgM [Pseudomonadota bacterium]
MSIEGIKTGLDNGSLVNDAPVTRAKAPAQHGSTPQTPPAAAHTGDRLSLTSEATLLKDVEKRLAALPIVDAQKVARIRNEISQGTYTIDPQKVADKLLNFEKLITKSEK